MYRKMNAQQATQAKRRRAATGVAGAAGEGLAGATRTGLAGEALLSGGTNAPGSAMAMKECPVCKARCFADMPVCYNCLHSFGTSERQDAAKTAERGADGGMDRWAGPGADAEGWQEQVEIPVAGFDDVLPGENLSAPLPPKSSLEDGSGIERIVPVEETALAADGPFGITVNVPEGLTAACRRTEGGLLRPDQLMEVIISIKVAQDACSKQQTVPAGRGRA